MDTFNDEQQVVVDAREGQFAVLAGPGSGKSTALVGRYRALIEDGVPKTDIINLTFSKEAADQMMKRAAASREEFCSFHSLGYRICRLENGNQPVEPELRHRLLCKLSSKYGLEYKVLAAYISKCRRNDISPADAAKENGTIKFGFPRAYGEYEEVRKQGGWTDFDSMLADSLTLLRNPEIRARWQFKYVQIDESQDTEKCQPPGTLVRKIIGNPRVGHRIVTEDTPIELLKDGDRVVSWCRREAGLWARKAEPISISCREFKGNLITIACGQKKTQVTPDHQMYVTMNGTQEDHYLVYLMYRSDLGFRVGQCAMRYCRNTSKKRKSMPGLGTRFAEEKAEKGWILKVTKDKDASRVWEQIISCNYGIPYATYGEKTWSGRFRKRNAEVSKLIFMHTAGRGQDCLADMGLSFDHPLFVWEGGRRKSPSKRYFITSAMNVIPQLMSLPSTEDFQQEQITEVWRTPYEGPVYSLNVPKKHTYIADGLVVKNCQWDIARLLTEKHGNILAVGDRNQAIYGFRDAVVDFETLMRSIWPATQTLYLGYNYRSHKILVDYVKKKAPHQSPLNDRMVSARADAGTAIEYKKYLTEADESRYNIEDIIKETEFKNVKTH